MILYGLYCTTRNPDYNVGNHIRFFYRFLNWLDAGYECTILANFHFTWRKIHVNSPNCFQVKNPPREPSKIFKFKNQETFALATDILGSTTLSCFPHSTNWKNSGRTKFLKSNIISKKKIPLHFGKIHTKN